MHPPFSFLDCMIFYIFQINLIFLCRFLGSIFLTIGIFHCDFLRIFLFFCKLTNLRILKLLTSASGQHAPQVAPKIKPPKIKNARKKDSERNKPKAIYISVMRMLSNFYLRLTFDEVAKSV